MTPIEKLADQVGFHKSYVNSFGDTVYATDESRKALLKAMGFDVSSDIAVQSEIDKLKNQEWLDFLQPTEIIKSEDPSYFITISVPAESRANKLKYEITLEKGEVITGEADLASLKPIDEKVINQTRYQKFSVELPRLIEGYHKMLARLENGKTVLTGSNFIIVAPKTGFSPKDAADYKMWGLAAQLYSLKTDNSWGIGDFGDLDNMVKVAGTKGVSTIGLNPLHPLYPGNPAHRSPYSPTSRTFLNTLYIDVTKAPNFNDCQAVQALTNSADFKDQLEQANAQEHIDYQHVAHLKYQALELLHKDFVDSHVKKNTPENQEFAAFKQKMGESLLLLATFDALYEHFRKTDFNAFGWTSWPEAYQDHNSAAVKEFQKTHNERIDYFMFNQWLADRQLAAVSQTAKQSGMALGLYLDLAVGCDGGGADVWSNRSLYVSGGAVGAPPDATNLLGQDWGLTPINPLELRRQGFQPFVEALRSNMRHAGAIRIDHVLGYMRQYWVAPGKKADEGIYITFPFEDLLRIIALESRRDSCVVIGEDLGTTPEGFGEIMSAAGLLSYKILFFERWESGLFLRPEHYPEQAMVTVSTHDLPTLASWWTGNDLKWRNALNLYPNDEMSKQDKENRVLDRERLIAALIDMGVLKQEDAPQKAPAIINSQLEEAVQSYLAKSPCSIQMIPLEDALGMHEQVNIPGTIDEHPNWLQRLAIQVDDLWNQKSMASLIDVMQRERPIGS
ncbi:4-alpha-glucanotransferase [Aliikangiella marina]|uniref:4-alpha-glucanotransferase n=1 Tax=Aliikangiella marina TaxID=1712262 RepID=A0A545TCU0_9GAMM|nr:4-alpha-glucanotransferase [Aliikangiella marina]TQV75042.1 4-alpha-glucanotransferase [Aliikangiella marina]